MPWLAAQRLIPTSRWAFFLVACLGLVLVPTPVAAASACESEAVIPDDLENLRSTCEILWEFYNDLDDPGVLDDPENPYAWGSSTRFSDWQGLAFHDGRLVALDLGETGIRGPLSPVLSELDDLVALELDQNELAGPIPAEFGDLTRLQLLIIFGNELTGPIPARLGELPDLSFLHLGDNELTGHIPKTLADSGALTVLDLSANQLTGPISEALGGLKNLTYLNLHTNQLTGPIPEEISQLTRLEILDLGRNPLGGQIPSELGLLTDLTYVSLHTNQLTGPIPPELGNLHKLKVLIIHSNQLSGPLPPELGRLSGLELLDLGGNRLAGQLPVELGMLTNLTYLSLHSNEFTGPIPKEWAALTELKTLSLLNNKLTGPVPPELAHLTEPASTGSGGTEPSGSAEDDAFAGDPLGLIAHTEWWRDRTLGTQTWELWFCDVPLGDSTVDQSKVKRLLNSEIASYFRSLSDGKYDPRFEIAGDVKADDRDGCAREARTKSPDALLAVVTDAADGQAYGAGRGILLSADSVVRAPRRRAPRLFTIVHEIGHALDWPHSYGGNTELRPPTDSVWNPTDDWTTQVSEYDNPMDLMSGPSTANANIATIAINRYAAGWIEPGDVSIHPGGAATYELAAPGESGTQMLVLPLGRAGVFYTLGARLGFGYDIAVPRQAVEVYRIDQGSAASGFSDAGLDRRTKPYPPEPTNESASNRHMTDHVHGVGETFQLGRYEVVVTERTASGFVVTVEGGTVTVPDPPPDPGPAFEGRFADDDGNTHEANIEIIAELGISLGCNPPDNDRYCPKQTVKRSQMMAFLARALGEENKSDATTSRFSDVGDNAWYLSSLERLADLGVVEPYEDGTFRPSEPVTRLDMAVFMSRAFSSIGEVAEPAGVFGDVPADSEYAGVVEGILAAGVTDGCSPDPLLYCPDRPVRRDQMASFFARALKKQNARVSTIN